MRFSISRDKDWLSTFKGLVIPFLVWIFGDKVKTHAASGTMRSN